MNNEVHTFEDEQLSAPENTSLTSLFQFFIELTAFQNAQSTVFQKLPTDFQIKLGETLGDWYGYDFQQKIQHFDEFLLKKDDIMRELATTHFDQYEGYTMLNLAAYSQKVQILEALLVAGVDVNEAANKYCKTALHWGVEQCNWSIVLACIEYKANTQLKNSSGETALEHAEALLPGIEKGNVIWFGMPPAERASKPQECRNIIALLKKNQPSVSPGLYYAAPNLGAVPTDERDAHRARTHSLSKCSIQ